MKDLGEIHYCLGITIVHDKERNSICMHQKQYVNSIMEKFGLASAKTVHMATPADGNVQLRKQARRLGRVLPPYFLATK